MTDDKAAEAKLYNPWAEFIENVLSGDNYFRNSEYRELLDCMDGYIARIAELEAQVATARDDGIEAAAALCNTAAQTFSRQHQRAEMYASDRNAREIRALKSHKGATP